MGEEAVKKAPESGVYGMKEWLEKIDRVVRKVFGPGRAVQEAAPIKEGMTNDSFRVRVTGEQDGFVIRLNGAGTAKLLDRDNEEVNYAAIRNLGISDELVSLDSEAGYKVTRFTENVRNCDSSDEADLQRCMELLRRFHGQGLTVPHEFDVFREILFYKGLWLHRKSFYPDYEEVEREVFALRDFVEAQCEGKVLTHVDAVPDNFLMMPDGDVRLIDWEYASMADPHMDIAMFCLYAGYGREQVDRLIDIYFEGGCREEQRMKIYAYIAAGGLLWSNWCEYKEDLGITFGAYAESQFRYGKEYARIVHSWLEEKNIPVAAGKKKDGKKEMHKAERAIIMAAGFGSRLAPFTEHTPKPLLKVNGVPMIETSIRLLERQGIHEIYVVVGYMKERYSYLTEKYPSVRLVENPLYAEANNISSLYAAREFLENVVILDGDQVIGNPDVLRPKFSRSGYCCSWCGGETDEWLLQLENGIVTSCSRTGGSGGWQLYSVSFWSEEDGRRLRRDLEAAFAERGIRDVYWDDVALNLYPRHYSLGIREVRPGDITEIDTVEELIAADPSYREALEEMENGKGRPADGTER